jgi:hypothetical protein
MRQVKWLMNKRPIAVRELLLSSDSRDEIIEILNAAWNLDFSVRMYEKRRVKEGMFGEKHRERVMVFELFNEPPVDNENSYAGSIESKTPDRPLIV